MTRLLFRVPISRWVLATAQAMDAAHTTDAAAWRAHWAESYTALGGHTTSGTKGCPRSAAYALWYLGWLKGAMRPHQDWPSARIHRRLGKNAAYAVIAARLLTRGTVAPFHSSLWPRVRDEFRRQTGESAANSDQGAAKVALLLFLDGSLVGPLTVAV